MGSIINNVRAFSRESKEEVKDIDIHKPIEDAFMLLTAQLKSHSIEVIREFGEKISKVMGNTNQLQQVFINLIANARDAMEENGKGKIWVVTRSREARSRSCFQEQRTPYSRGCD